MDTASQTLLIIVSAVLAMFLIVSAIAVILFIRILNHVKKITERAEGIAGSMESAATAFEKAAGPMAVLKLIGNIINVANKSRRKEKNGKR